MAVRGIACDLDGVLRRFPAQAEVERRHGVPPGTVAAVAFAEDLLTPAITGAVDDNVWRLGIVQRLTPRLGRAAASLLVAEWSAHPGVVDQEVLLVLRQMRSRAPVVLLTNATTRLRQDLERLDMTQEFDAVISSAETGVAKPSPGAFAAAAHALGRLAGAPVSSGGLLFIDDTPGHVAAAAALGWQTHSFNDVESLRDLVTGWGTGPVRHCDTSDLG